MAERNCQWDPAEDGHAVCGGVCVQPRVFSIDPLLTDAECNWIIKKAEPDMVSTTTHTAGSCC